MAMVSVMGPMANVIFKLGKLLSDEYKLQKGVRKKIQTLTRDMESMHAALCKVAKVPQNQLDDEVKLWARDVRELSYNVEDILDTFLVRVDSYDEDPNPNKLNRAAKKISKLFNKSKAHHQIAGMIKAINEQAEEVAERHRRYRADDIVAKPATTSTVDPRLAAMFREVSQLVGVDKSSGELISMLSSSEDGYDGSSNGNMKIVSVVGAGGLGKTTLAKAVYDSLKTKFGCGAFVPVGQNPDLKKVLRDILLDLDKHLFINSNMDKLDERQLLNEVRGFLQDKRYFVVIDDIWEPETWETLKLALVGDNCGSRIIITTRKFEVAKEAGEVYMLQPLSHGNSKRLFYMRLFGGEDKCPNKDTDELSDQILKKCGGVPLAVITMASLLLGKSREEWIKVCSSPGLCRDKAGRHVENTMYILALSYYDLPCDLRTCLLYLSIFPEDTLIDKESLIWKWIAEGFVEHKPGRGLFEVGEEYFHDLINRSMIQGVDSGGHGIMDGCQVHDMVLDLIISMSNEENFISVGGTLAQSHTHRLVQKNKELDLTEDNSHVNLPQVRSFIALQCDIVKWTLHPRLNLIRVLALEGCIFSKGCDGLENIGKLQHLRYLGFGVRGDRTCKLPEEIGGLKFLQTLDLSGDVELTCSIGKLTQLVCLRALATIAPVGVLIGKLTALEELQNGGHHDGKEFQRQFVKDLGNLSKLRVLKLNISDWIMDENMQIHLMQSLGNLKVMQHLMVNFMFGEVIMNVWDAAMPSTYRDLRYLFLFHVKFLKLPSWISSAHLPSLSHLELNVHDLDEQGLNALGGLPELCYLKLFCRGQTSMIIQTDGCFQKLRSLVLFWSVVQFVASGECQKKDDSRVVFMPCLEELQFYVHVKDLMQSEDVSCGDLSLKYLPSIRKVKATFWCDGAYEDDVERLEAALGDAIKAHRNCPTLQIEYIHKEHMKSRSDKDEEDEEETLELAIAS